MTSSNTIFDERITNPICSGANDQWQKIKSDLLKAKNAPGFGFFVPFTEVDTLGSHLARIVTAPLSAFGISLFLAAVSAVAPLVSVLSFLASFALLPFNSKNASTAFTVGVVAGVGAFASAFIAIISAIGVPVSFIIQATATVTRGAATIGHDPENFSSRFVDGSDSSSYSNEESQEHAFK